MTPEIKSKIEQQADAYPLKDESIRPALTEFATFGYSLAEKEIERMKGLIETAWQQAIINCEVENGTHDSGMPYIHFRQFKTDNNL